MERPNAWKKYTRQELEQVMKTGEAYKDFLNRGKTERECAREAVAMLEEAGYQPLEQLIREGKKVQAGDRIYVCIMGKAVLAFLMGKSPWKKA